MKKTAVAVAVAASALGMSQFAVADFVKDSKLSLDLRNYYYNQDTDGGKAGGQWGQGFMLNYQSGFTAGTVGFGVDLFGAAGYQLADHGDNTGNNGAGNMLFQEGQDRLNKGGATLKARVGNTNAYAGALRPTVPVYVNNDARLLPQMVEGVLVTNQDVAGLTLVAGHMTKVSTRDSDQWTDLPDAGVNGEFSLLGADYKVMDGLTAQYYFGNVADTYQQHFAGLKYSANVAGGKLGADVRYFNTKDESAADEGTNNLWSVMVDYSVSGHSLGLGYQKTSDEYKFRNLGSSKYIISERMIGPGAMHEADEAVMLVRYGFDFGTVGVKGLNASVVHQMGDGGSDKAIGDRAETDLIVGYTLQEGQFKGLGARLMHGMYRPDEGKDIDQTRVIVSYSIPLM